MKLELGGNQEEHRLLNQVEGVGLEQQRQRQQQIQQQLLQQQQFQLQGAYFTRGTVALLARRPVDRALEAGVAKAVEATLGNQQLLLVVGQVTQQFAGVFIAGAGADRYAQDPVLAATAGTVGALAVLATLGGVETLETVVDQGVQVLVGDQIDITAVPTITTTMGRWSPRASKR